MHRIPITKSIKDSLIMIDWIYLLYLHGRDCISVGYRLVSQMRRAMDRSYQSMNESMNPLFLGWFDKVWTRVLS